MKTKTVVCFLAILALASVTAIANPVFCGPDLTHDSIAVQAGCPGNTLQIVVEQGTFFASLNDNPLSAGIASNGFTIDADVNDAWITGRIVAGPSALFDKVYITWGGALSAWNNKIVVGSATSDASHTGEQFAGLFAVGSILNLTGLAQDGNSYSSNPALNPGGADYFYETQTTSPSSVPEPNLAWIGAVLMGTFLTARARQNPRNKRH